MKFNRLYMRLPKRGFAAGEEARFRAAGLRCRARESPTGCAVDADRLRKMPISAISAHSDFLSPAVQKSAPP